VVEIRWNKRIRGCINRYKVGTAEYEFKKRFMAV